MNPRTGGPVPGPTTTQALSRLVRTAVAVTAALVVTACGAPAGDVVRPPHEVAPPSERAVMTLQPALVQITATFTGWVRNQGGAYANGGRPFTYTSNCTGFGVHPDGYIATAGHCLDTTGAGGVRDPFVRAVAEDLVAARPDLRLEDVLAHGRSAWIVEGRTAGSPLESEVRVTGIPGAPPGGVPARVVDVRPLMAGDVALLKVETADLPTLELATGADVAVGTPVLAAGFPRAAGEVAGPDARASIKDGAVDSTRPVGGGPVYEISTALETGMSGGPAVDHTGRVLGIITVRGTDAQPLNLAVPASGIAELLSRNGTRNELGPGDVLYREALDAYYTGEYTDAVDALDRLLQQVPAHPRAGELRTDAEAARERHGDASENRRDQMLVRLSTGTGAVLLIVVGAVLVARRRRRARVAHVPAPQAPISPLTGQHSDWQWQGGPVAPFAASAHPPEGTAAGPHQPYVAAPCPSDTGTAVVRSPAPGADPAGDPPPEPSASPGVAK